MSSSTHVQSLKRFFTHLVSKTQLSMQSQISDFYQNVLNLKIKQQSQLNQDNSEPNHKKSQIKQHRSSPTSINLSKKIANNLSQIYQQPLNKQKQNSQTQQSSIFSKNNFKINTRLNKLNKISKHVQKTTSPSQIQSSPIKNSQSKQKFTSQIKQITIKKLQLKNKLRKLNSQLQKQKHSYFSFHSSNQELNHSHLNPQQQTLLAKLKNSALITNKNSTPFAFSRLKSKSDAQFNIKRQSLKDKQAVYSPQKHEAAFKLIQKMHSQKLKKHEKILNEMKKKQQKQIETVKRLQIQRKKQKQQKLRRQRILLMPNSRDSLKSYISYSDRKKLHTKSQHCVLDRSIEQKQKYEVQQKQKNIEIEIPIQLIQQINEEQKNLMLLTNLQAEKKKNHQKQSPEGQRSIQQMQNEFLY